MSGLPLCALKALIANIHCYNHRIFTSTFSFTKIESGAYIFHQDVASIEGPVSTR